MVRSFSHHGGFWPDMDYSMDNNRSFADFLLCNGQEQRQRSKQAIKDGEIGKLQWICSFGGLI